MKRAKLIQAAGRLAQSSGGGGGGSFDPYAFPFVYHWQNAATRSGSWVTTTGGQDNGDGLTEYVNSIPNLNSANAGSANGNEFFVDDFSSDQPNGKGYVIDDANKGIKHWNTGGGEVKLKVRMYEGGGSPSESGLRHAQGDFFEIHCWTVTNGYGTNDSFRKDNNNVEHKMEGGSKWKHTDKYNSAVDGTGTQMNDGISPDFLTSMDDGKTYFVVCAREISQTPTIPSINALVPGTYADGPKRIQWIGEVTSAGDFATDVFRNDTLNESIVDAGNYDFSPAYVDFADPRSDNSNNPKEFRYNELSILHYFAYGPRMLTLQEVEDCYNYLCQTFG